MPRAGAWALSVASVVVGLLLVAWLVSSISSNTFYADCKAAGGTVHSEFLYFMNVGSTLVPQFEETCITPGGN